MSMSKGIVTFMCPLVCDIYVAIGFIFGRKRLVYVVQTSMANIHAHTFYLVVFGPHKTWPHKPQIHWTLNPYPLRRLVLLAFIDKCKLQLSL